MWRKDMGVFLDGGGGGVEGNTSFPDVIRGGEESRDKVWTC